MQRTTCKSLLNLGRRRAPRWRSTRLCITTSGATTRDPASDSCSLPLPRCILSLFFLFLAEHLRVVCRATAPLEKAACDTILFLGCFLPRFIFSRALVACQADNEADACELRDLDWELAEAPVELRDDDACDATPARCLVVTLRKQPRRRLETRTLTPWSLLTRATYDGTQATACSRGCRVVAAGLRARGRLALRRADARHHHARTARQTYILTRPRKLGTRRPPNKGEKAPFPLSPNRVSCTSWRRSRAARDEKSLFSFSQARAPPPSAPPRCKTPGRERTSSSSRRSRRPTHPSKWTSEPLRETQATKALATPLHAGRPLSCVCANAPTHAKRRRRGPPPGPPPHWTPVLPHPRACAIWTTARGRSFNKNEAGVERDVRI